MAKPATFDAALMDGDDTLFMTSALYLQVYEEELARYNVPFEDEERRKAIGRPAILLLKGWCEKYGINRDHFRWYEEFRERLYGTRIREVQMRPGADALLDSFEACEIPHALVTNAPRFHVEQMASVFPRLKLFPWITRDDPRISKGEYKPHPRPFLLGAEELGVDPRRCVAFGDTDNDSIGATAAGCYMVGLPHEHSSAEQLHHSHVLLSDLSDFRLDMIPHLPLAP